MKNHLLPVFIILISLFSCQDNIVEKSLNCTLSNSNAIGNLKIVENPSPDSLTIFFQNDNYQLIVASSSVTQNFYDLGIGSKTTSLWNDNGEMISSLTFYYPNDSSNFNNAVYLTKFEIKDSNTQHDRVSDSLVFVRQCPFNLYLELTTPSGGEYKSNDRFNRSSDFSQIDSIQYIEREEFEYAQYKVYGHFETVLLDKNGDEEPIRGYYKIQFETYKL